jgi:antitoxin component of MazEF toxin-antitoxin module
MKTFNLSGKITISVYTKVDAETLEEAKKIAYERSIEAYSWGNPEQDKEVWVNSDYDGEVYDVSEDE